MLARINPSVSSFRKSFQRSYNNLCVPNYNKVPESVSAAEAVKVVKSGSRIFLHGAAATPHTLLAALAARAPELKGVEIVQIHNEGPAPHAAKEVAGSFRVRAMFTGANMRQAVQEGRADFHPIFLSEIGSLFDRDILPLDAAFISVSPPDKHGFVSLGTSVDVSMDAVRNAKMIIAQINKHVPRTFGDSVLHVSNIHKVVYDDKKLPTAHLGALEPEAIAIGKHIAELVEDGSTLQMGIGNIPDAVLSQLHNHKDLGIHTEMFSDGVLELVKKGVITNRWKNVHPGYIVASFLVGSEKLYDFVDDNVSIKMYPSKYVNDPAVIKQNPKVVAINSCIEIDLAGQVCACSIGNKIFSGIGGQVDFERGAALSQGGKPIIAVPSRTSKGQTRIVPYLKQGAGVVTSFGHVHWVVTEFGKVNLFGKSLRERAQLLISIAHPEDRENLAKHCKLNNIY